MVHISFAEARKRLSKLIDEVYFNNKTFIITRSGIPMIKLEPLKKSERKKIYK